MLPIKSASLIAPDQRMNDAYEGLLRLLNSSCFNDIHASCGFRPLAELLSWQREEFLNLPHNAREYPFWLRDDAEQRLLACLRFAVRDNTADITYAIPKLYASDPVLFGLLLRSVCAKAMLLGVEHLCMALPPYPTTIAELKQLLSDCTECNIADGYLKVDLKKARLQVNSYAASAAFYEEDLEQRSLSDLPFYLKQAADFNARDVLDLACGSGRLSLALLGSGCNVVALDHSASLLRQLGYRLRLFSATQRRRLHCVEADMRDFTLPQSFDLILIPFRSLQMLLSSEDVERCLQSVRRHLRLEGRLIFDLIDPDTVEIERLIMPESTMWSKEDPIDHSLITKKTWCDLIDREPPLLRQGLIYEILQPDGRYRRYEDLLKYRFYSSRQIQELLLKSGLYIYQSYGSFCGNPLGQGREQIYIAAPSL